jgi:hypothetical protein
VQCELQLRGYCIAVSYALPFYAVTSYLEDALHNTYNKEAVSRLVE